MRLGELHPRPPYDLHRSAWLLSRYHGVLDIYDGTYYTRALAHEGQTVLIRVASARDALTVDLVSGTAAAPLLDKVGHMLAVNFDLTPFYAIAKQDTRLWYVIEPLAGLRHFLAETMFEALMMVIIEQQISLKSALRAQRAIAEWGGGHVQHAGTDYYTFPTPQTIAAADHDELHRVLKITHRRVDLMQRIAQDVSAGVLPLESMRGEDAYTQLTAIKGVGHWTAAWALIRGAGCYDYVGYNDVALRDAVAHYFHDSDERISAAEVKSTFDRYAPYDGLAAFYTLMRWAVDRY